MSYLLEIKGVSAGYGEKIVLKDIDLFIKEGEILGIIGPNGCGKTTLLRLIGRVIEPKKGSLRFEGRELRKFGLKELSKRISHVSQDEELDIKMVAIDYVLLGRMPYRNLLKFFEEEEDIRVAEEALSLTGLSYARSELVCNLSGGERQLLRIARALAQMPKLMLLDEPTSHLDIAHQVMILNLLKRLNDEKGITLVVVFHDLNLASEFCERLVLMSDGRILRDGPSAEVLKFDLLESTYGTPLIVKTNPITEKPYVFPVLESWLRR